MSCNLDVPDSAFGSLSIVELMKIKILALMCLFPMSSAFADKDTFARCAKNFPNDDVERLKCFDKALAAPVATAPVVNVPVEAFVRSQAESAAQVNLTPSRTYLSRVWHLDNPINRDPSSLDRLRPHKQSYLITRETSSANTLPGSPAIS